MKKRLDVLVNLFNYQNYSINSKRIFFDKKSAAEKLQKIASRGQLGILNSSSEEKLTNFITSRHMRKTLLPSNHDEVSPQPEMNALKHFLDVIRRKWKESKELICLNSPTTSLNFHTQQPLLRNIISKESTGDDSAQSEQESWGGPESFKLIKFITDDFDALVNNNPAVLIFFYAYWCRHCTRLKIPFGKAALMAKEAGLNMVFAAFDVTTNPELADEKGVVGIPTLKYYYNGKFVSLYRGQRTADELFEFVKNPPAPIKEGGVQADI